MHYDLCCIGHITLDKIVVAQSTVFMPGGTSFYFSHALSKSDIQFLLVTAIGPTESEVINNLREQGIETIVLRSKHTVHFENIYGTNQDSRQQRVVEKADPFRWEELASLQAGIFHLGPLLADDISDEVIKAMASKGKVSLDVQGLLRSVENKNVVAVDWKTKKDVLPHVHFLKASQEEMQVLTGTANIKKAARQMADWGAKEIIITAGSKGSVIYNNEQFYLIPAFYPSKVKDATGCGDTYMAGYLSQRVKGIGIQESGEFAAAMASLKIGKAGMR